MSKHDKGTLLGHRSADLITYLRLPCLMIIMYFSDCFKKISFEIFWLCSLFLVIGMLLDAVDGYVARKFCEPSAWGKFADQLFDKIFIWPIWFVYNYNYPMPIYWQAGSCLMFGLDCVSAWEHFGDYQLSRKIANRQGFGGAVGFGKIKFWLQNMVMLICFTSTCPFSDGESVVWYRRVSNILHNLGNSLLTWSSILICLAIILAVFSLYKRAGRKGNLTKITLTI